MMPESVLAVKNLSGGLCGEAMVSHKRFGVVTLLSKVQKTSSPRQGDNYVLGVRKLGESIKRWAMTHEFEQSVDMVVLLVRPIRAADFQPSLHLHGWRTCEVCSRY